jgi:D-alanyl-D-alanine carboxypeptidase
MTRRVLLAALALAALAGPALSRDEKGDLEKQVDALVAKHVRADGPGCAIALVVSGEVVLRKGYGLASIDGKAAIGSGTLFDLASCSKAFTAAAVEILADRKQLSLDDEVAKFLPELKSKDPKHPLRVAHLLGHTSGLVEYTDHLDRIRTSQQVLEHAASRRSKKPPGSEFEYCNTNYALLSLIVERVSKKSLREFIRSEIFSPLAMTASDVLDPTTPPLKERATGYARSQRGTPPKRVWIPSKQDTPGITGDGNVFSTIDDLVKWDAALAAGRLVQKETLARALTSGKLSSDEETGYGFGWCLGERKGHKLMDHSGGWAGTSTYIGRFVADGVTVIVLANDEDLEASELGLAIVDLVLR